MCKVSVIVPVFNVEKYLRQCIESLIEQTLTDIEILLIDDGSPDSSGEICDEYAKSDSRIRVFHKENEGLSLTRKFGVSKASGEYICFLDSDDYARSDFLESLYLAISENNADLAECDYTTFSDTMQNKKNLYNAEFTLDRDGFFDKIVKNTIINGKTAVVVWNKIYKCKLIQSFVKDYGLSPLEDYIFNMQYYTAVNKYAYVNKPLVNYRQVTNSLSRKINPKAYMILKDVQEAKRDFMQKTGLDDAECIEESNLWYISYTYNLLKNIFLTNVNMSPKDKETAAMNILTDDMLLEICKNSKARTDFTKNIIIGNYTAIIKELRHSASAIRFRQRLSLVKQKILKER